jgi:DNA adenine methylase
MKPILKWAGGKRRLLPELLKRKPKEFNAYHEPFLGGGALFFELEHPDSWVSDANTHLIEFYRCVATGGINLSLISGWCNGGKELYYKVRSSYNRCNQLNYDDGRQSNRFLYLNKAGFNGLYRVNRKDEFNVPYGSGNPSIPTKEDLNKIRELLLMTNISHEGFESIEDRAEPGDWIYFDPPYHGTFSDYTERGFQEKEHDKLAGVFDRLNNRGCYCLLSNSKTSYVMNRYKPYTIETVSRNEVINSDTSNRGKVKEVLIRNY